MFYIRHLAVQIREAAHKAQGIVEKVKKLIEVTAPFESHGAQLVFFLKQTRNQYGQIKCFYEANYEMLNNF